MAVAPREWRDTLWLAWFVLQVPVILFIDGVPYLYPAWLYKPPGSPLHFAQQLRDYDVAAYNDPLSQAHLAPAFMPLLFALEVGFQLPTVLYALARLLRLRRRTTTGALELLLLVYAFETAFSTVLCMHSVFFLDEAVFTPAQRSVFLWQLMGPWLVIPSLMFVDMYWRLYTRLSARDAVKRE